MTKKIYLVTWSKPALPARRKFQNTDCEKGGDRFGSNLRQVIASIRDKELFQVTVLLSDVT